MPLASPTALGSRISKTSYKVTVSVPAGTNADLYVRNSPADLDGYSFYGSRIGPGDITVSGRVANSYQFFYVVARDNTGSLSLPVFGTVDLNTSDSLNSAIRRYWYSNTELTSKFKGGLFINEVPETFENKPLVMPYCMFRSDQSEFTFLMAESYFESSEVDFVVFAPGAALVDECLDLLQKSLDFQLLNFSQEGDNTLSIMPNNRSLTSENFRHKDGNLIFRGSLNYDIVVTRVR